MHPKFARDPGHYVRAFLLLQKDLLELFDYVEPAERNLDCYSYRIHALLLRSCAEAEANFKAVLRENGYSGSGEWSMKDYKKVNMTHRLSSYLIKVPNWTGAGNIRSPFSAWRDNGSLPWYKAYNESKHDRHGAFSRATLEALIDAVCGVLVLLSAQFETNDFSSGNTLLALNEGPSDGMESAIGGHFRVSFPDDWPEHLQYDFNWQVLQNDDDPFEEFDYDAVV